MAEIIPDKKEVLPTQKFIDVKAVQDGVIVLKGGGLRRVLLVSGINFDLKSEDEQGAILGLFQNFINSLNFSVQILIHSRKINIDGYLSNLSIRETQESNELLKNQIAEYREFIKTFVAENAIMNKAFFVVVPYDPINLPGGSEKIAKSVFDFLKKKGVQKPTERLNTETQDEEKKLREHMEQLGYRVDQVTSGLNQIDLRVVPLNDAEVIELLYNLYNPGIIEKKGLQIEELQKQ
ncbi:MAG TPA: hypothetical protein VJB92_01650 [Candidatus Paceibacterota bacterium]